MIKIAVTPAQLDIIAYALDQHCMTLREIVEHDRCSEDMKPTFRRYIDRMLEVAEVLP